MSATHDVLDDRLVAFIEAQHVFFVATARLAADGCVNVSPKGYDSFAILDPTTVAYLDFGGLASRPWRMCARTAALP